MQRQFNFCVQVVTRTHTDEEGDREFLATRYVRALNEERAAAAATTVIYNRHAVHGRSVSFEIASLDIRHDVAIA